MNEVAAAYIPVLHEGYRRFLEAHAAGRPLYLIGSELHSDYRPLAKDIRALDPGLVAASIEAWRLCSSVEVLDVEGAERLASRSPAMTLPAEDVSYQVVDRYFGRCEVSYAPALLRWDKSRSVQLLEPTPARRVDGEGALAELGDAALAELSRTAEDQASRSVDWWRRVGAAIRFADGTIAAAHNEHNPHPLSPYAAGDPRANFSKGVHFELSTATHAEARLIAQAARDGRSTRDAVLYVTDFPCPPCAKLIAAAGIVKLYFRTGYAVLDGQDVLATAGVEIVQVTV